MVIASLALFPIHWGFSQGFSSVLVQQLQAANSSLRIINEDISWIGKFQVQVNDENAEFYTYLMHSEKVTSSK